MLTTKFTDHGSDGRHCSESLAREPENVEVSQFRLGNDLGPCWRRQTRTRHDEQEVGSAGSGCGTDFAVDSVSIEVKLGIFYLNVPTLISEPDGAFGNQVDFYWKPATPVDHGES